ncbi:MAG: hypothetical protein PHF21_03805 [Bacilli bacterium]|nr:hypothetical protein [Bacilli bacterium]
MIITSLVHFIFIKDLEKIEYNFGNASYLIKRENINMFFNKKGFKLENLLEDDNWTQHIKNELKNKEFIKNFFEN